MSHSVHDQLRFLNQWFRTWSEYQKDDFLHVLASKLSPKSSIITAEVNGIVNGMQGMSTTSGRPPSLFACQIKLFNEWWDSWSEAERGKLTEELKKDDAKFWADLESQMDGTRAKDFEDFFTVEPSEADTSPMTSTENGAVPEKAIEITVEPSVPEAVTVNMINTAEEGVIDQDPTVDNFKTTIEVNSLEPEEEVNPKTPESTELHA